MADKTGEAVTVTRGRGRPKGTGGNSRPDRAKALAPQTEPGDNSKFVSHLLWCRNLPEIDTTDAVQVEKRIDEYFLHCVETDMRPTVSTCALAIGVSRQTFNNWGRGQYRSESHLAPVKKAYNFLGSLMEEFMLNGKINPVSGIFLMKNNCGYTDQQEVVLTPNNPLGESTSDVELQQKYLQAVPKE